MFFDKCVIKISENLKENTSVRVSFKLNLQISDVKFYKEKSFMKGGFLWSLLNFWWHLFKKKLGAAASENGRSGKIHLILSKA